jgi:hypothetical protein
MRGLKAFGEPIAAFAIVARTKGATWLAPDRQTADIHIRIAPTHRFNALGTAEIVRVP